MAALATEMEAGNPSLKQGTTKPINTRRILTMKDHEKEKIDEVFSGNDEATRILEDDYWTELIVSGFEIHQLARMMRTMGEELQPFLFLFLKKTETSPMAGPTIHQLPDGTLTVMLNRMLGESHGIVTVFEGWMKVLAPGEDPADYAGRVSQCVDSVEVINSMIYFGNGCGRQLSKSIVLVSVIDADGRIGKTTVTVSQLLGNKCPTPVEVH